MTEPYEYTEVTIPQNVLFIILVMWDASWKKKVEGLCGQIGLESDFYIPFLENDKAH